MIDERTEREQVEAENIKLKNHANELNTKLSFTTGESKDALQEIDNLKAEHQKLTVACQELESEKKATQEKRDALKESTDKTIQELELKIKEL